MQLLQRAVAAHPSRSVARRMALQAPTVVDLMARLEQDYEMQGRKSLDTARYHWQPIIQQLGALKAQEVTADDLREYARARQKAGLANGTINRELAGLRRAYKLGQLAGVVTLSPPFPMLRETGLRQGTYTREEVERVVAHLPAHVVPVVWFAYHTGRRRGEILQIKWEDVNLEEGWIRIQSTTTKTGEPDRIPLVGELKALLLTLIPTRMQCPYIFSYNQRPFKNFSRSWQTALRKCGLKDKLFHDLRRTVATDLIEAGVSEQVAMRVTGHKTRSVFQRYHIVKSSAVRDGLEQMEAYRKGGERASEFPH